MIQFDYIPPWKQTCPLKIDGWKMYSPLKEVPFQGTWDMLVFRGVICFKWLGWNHQLVFSGFFSKFRGGFWRPIQTFNVPNPGSSSRNPGSFFLTTKFGDWKGGWVEIRCFFWICLDLLSGSYKWCKTFHGYVSEWRTQTDFIPIQ